MKNVIFLLFLFVFSIVNAQNWTSSTVKEMHKCKEISISVDFLDAKICGFSLGTFYNYYSQKKGVSEEYVDLLLDKFEMTFCEALSNKISKKLVSDKNVRFGLVFHLQKITDKGGYEGVLYATDKGIPTRVGIKIICPDGKWNEFEELLLENASRGVYKMPSNTNPMTFPFHKYE